MCGRELRCNGRLCGHENTDCLDLGLDGGCGSNSGINGIQGGYNVGAVGNGCITVYDCGIAFGNDLLVGFQRFVDSGQLDFIEVDPFIGCFQGRNPE